MKLNFAAIAAAIVVVFSGAVMRADPTSVRVFPGNWEGWFLYDDNTDTIDNSLGEFVLGPETAPAGVGSLEIATIGTGRPNVATYQFAGTPLASITELKFSTYNGSAGNPSGDTQRSGYLQFNVDLNGTDTWQRRLTYVPRNQGVGVVSQDTWQEWDAIAAGALWGYSGGTWPITGGTGLKTWGQILIDYPGVRIRVTDAFLGVRVGEPYTDGYVENIDAIKFGTAAGTTLFDFEPKATDICKKSAWMLLSRADGSPFANQGDCVSYVSVGTP
jgi:hypothetical protein